MVGLLTGEFDFPTVPTEPNESENSPNTATLPESERAVSDADTEAESEAYPLLHLHTGYTDEQYGDSYVCGSDYVDCTQSEDGKPT